MGPKTEIQLSISSHRILSPLCSNFGWNILLLNTLFLKTFKTCTIIICNLNIGLDDTDCIYLYRYYIPPPCNVRREGGKGVMGVAFERIRIIESPNIFIVC